MSRIKKIFKIIATSFLVVLVLLCIYTFVVTDIMKKDYVNVFGYTYFVVASGSMSGTIEVDDIIFVKITKDVKNDDIITFIDEDGNLITHRLVNRNGDRYITKGDVNNVSDDPITEDQIIGKVSLVVSPSFILKSIAIFLIIFILLALVNFDQIIKKFIVKAPQKPEEKLPDDIFANPKKKYEEPSSGLTVTINMEELDKLNKDHDDQSKKEEESEIFQCDDYFVFEPTTSKKKTVFEKETIDLVISVLKCKSSNLASARMNKKWLTRYQYIYKLCQMILYSDIQDLSDEINNPPFREIFDYDLDKSGLTETIRNRIYDLPIHLFLRVLTYCILYNDDEMFDGVYKIMKYKIAVDKDDSFKQIASTDRHSMQELKSLIAFMKNVSNRFDKKHVFDLDKIEKMVKIKNY
ncbi:MAG: signal peptidase I [Bacilli bacterium]|nr:signal peptidase I [Bacilli bacterium]